MAPEDTILEDLAPRDLAPEDLEAYGACTLDQDGCTTCGDMAVPVRLLELRGVDALVEDRLGQRAEIAVELVPDAQIGDILLVHGGIALGAVAIGVTATATTITATTTTGTTATGGSDIATRRSTEAGR